MATPSVEPGVRADVDAETAGADEAVTSAEVTFRELSPAGDGRLRAMPHPRTARLSGQAAHPPGRHPRSGDALAALDDVERAARDLVDARGRLATSVDRLRAAGFGQQQIDGLLARRVAEGTAGAR